MLNSSPGLLPQLRPGIVFAVTPFCAFQPGLSMIRPESIGNSPAAFCRPPWAEQYESAKFKNRTPSDRITRRTSRNTRTIVAINSSGVGSLPISSGLSGWSFGK
jgi:hypothetical protein